MEERVGPLAVIGVVAKVNAGEPGASLAHVFVSPEIGVVHVQWMDPEAAGADNGEGMIMREHRIVVPGVEKAFEFRYGREPPVAGRGAVRKVADAVRQSVAIRQRVRPGSFSEAVGMFQPDHAGPVVGHRAVAVIREMRSGVGRAFNDVYISVSASAAHPITASRKIRRNFFIRPPYSKSPGQTRRGASLQVRISIDPFLIDFLINAFFDQSPVRLLKFFQGVRGNRSADSEVNSAGVQQKRMDRHNAVFIHP